VGKRNLNPKNPSGSLRLATSPKRRGEKTIDESSFSCPLRFGEGNGLARTEGFLAVIHDHIPSSEEEEPSGSMEKGLGAL
jgi:hypothetical protein